MKSKSKKRRKSVKFLKRKTSFFDGTKASTEELNDLTKKFENILKPIETIIETFKEYPNDTDVMYINFRDEKSTLRIQCKIENQKRIAKLFLGIENLIVFNVEQVSISNLENRKKGYFAAILKLLEQKCETWGISVLVSGIVNHELAKNLNKNGFKLLLENFSFERKIIDSMMLLDDLNLNEYHSIDAIKIFESKKNREDIW